MLCQRALLALMILVWASCGGPTEPVPTDPDNIPVPRKVAEDDYIELTGGLRYHDFKVGTGDSAAHGDIVSVHYHGWLTDSTLFDSSYLRQEPYFFPTGNWSSHHWMGSGPARHAGWRRTPANNPAWTCIW